MTSVSRANALLKRANNLATDRAIGVRRLRPDRVKSYFGTQIADDRAQRVGIGEQVDGESHLEHDAEGRVRIRVSV